MHQDTPLISMIVAGLVLAYVFGMIANRFRLPPLVGYLVAGVLVGPFTPGFVADQSLANELAEIGVVLLMFGVGLHFSIKDLMSVRALAIPGALAQIVLATLLGIGLALALGWGLGAGIIFGLALSVASTVVLLKALQDKRLVETERGKIAVGWLIVEDMAMVLALVLIPAFASLAGSTVEVHDPFVSFVERLLGVEVNIWGVLALTLVKMAAFVGFMLVVGRRVIPWALHRTAHTGSRELFRLAVLAIALGVALGSSVLFGVSLALGAFFAGMILSESELSHRAAQETLPLRDAFAVLFFVSVGMLFDPAILVTKPLLVLATVAIIIVGKSVVAYGIVRVFGRSVSTALIIAASLAQIGEFSFILASLGVALGILPEEGRDLILAGALISIVLNPAVFFAMDLLRPLLESRLGAARSGAEGTPVRVEPGELAMTASAAEPTTSVDEDIEIALPTTKRGHVILIGFGRVGRVVGAGLRQQGLTLVVIEDSDSSIAAARGLGIEVVIGNAAATPVLELANVAGARSLVVAIPNAFEAGQVVEQGRKLNPALRIIARAHSDDEEAHLSGLGADTVVMGEREIGLGMLAWISGERASQDFTATEPTLAPLDPVIVGAATAVEPIAPIADKPPEVTDVVDEPPVAAGDETAAAPVVDQAEQTAVAPDPETHPVTEAEPAAAAAPAVMAMPAPDAADIIPEVHPAPVAADDPVTGPAELQAAVELADDMADETPWPPSVTAQAIIAGDGVFTLPPPEADPTAPEDDPVRGTDELDAAVALNEDIVPEIAAATADRDAISDMAGPAVPTVLPERKD